MLFIPFGIALHGMSFLSFTVGRGAHTCPTNLFPFLLRTNILGACHWGPFYPVGFAVLQVVVFSPLFATLVVHHTTPPVCCLGFCWFFFGHMDPPNWEPLLTLASPFCENSF